MNETAGGGAPLSAGAMGIYMSGPLSRGALTSLFLFPCKIHSFVRSEEATILSPRPLRPPERGRADLSRTGCGSSPPEGLVLDALFARGTTDLVRCCGSNLVVPAAVVTRTALAAAHLRRL